MNSIISTADKEMSHNDYSAYGSKLDRLTRAAIKSDCNLVLDLSYCQHVHSSIIQLWQDSREMLEIHRLCLILRNPRRKVSNLLKIVNMPFEIENTDGHK